MICHGSFPLSIIRYSTLRTMRWLALVGVPALFYYRLISTTTYRFQGLHHIPDEISFFNLSLLSVTLGWKCAIGAGTPLSLTDIMFQKDTSASVARIQDKSMLNEIPPLDLC